MPSKNYYIRPIPLSKGPRDKSQWTYRMNYGQSIESCAYVWYIEGSEPKILVDAGVKTEHFVAHGKTDQKDIQSLEDGLRKIGLSPSDIDIVILTHLHWDHVDLASEFTKARFIVQKSELEFARNPHPVAAAAYDKRLFNNLNLEVIDGDKEIIDGVRVMLTPGHTPGGQSVAVTTPKGVAIITGFCCIQENIEPPASAGASVITPGIHTNAIEAYDSALKVKNMGSIFVTLHDCGFKNVSRIPDHSGR